MKPGALAIIAALAAWAAAGPARAAGPTLDWGVDVFASLDAGANHWHDSFSQSGGVIGSPTFLQKVQDEVGGGVQEASTQATGSLGSLRGLVRATSSGFVLSSAQGFNDLSWYADLLITGTPGTQVALKFGARLDGQLAVGGSHYGGSVAATTFVAGQTLADWRIDALTAPGSFSAKAFSTQVFDVGTVVRVSSRMTVSAGAEQEDSAMEADAFNTSAFYVDVLTPGGGYVTGPGFVFQPISAVPEPAPALLWATGALGLAAWRRWRPRRQAFGEGPGSPLIAHTP